MNTYHWRLPAAGLVFLVCGSLAVGGDFTHPSGFSFTYPNGWVPVSLATIGAANQALPNEIQDWMSKNKVDLNRVEVLLVRQANEPFLENINVIVENQQMPADNNAVTQLTKMLQQQYAGMGGKIDNTQGRVQNIGARSVVVIEFQSQLPGVPFGLRQKQVLFPGGGKTFIVTCTAKADTFAMHQATFESVLVSFQVPAPAATPRAKSFWNQLVVGGIVGGVVGGLAAGLAGAAFAIKKLFAGKDTSNRRFDS